MYEELNNLLNKKYKQYRMRMVYLGQHLRWKVRMPWEDLTKVYHPTHLQK